MAPLGFEDIHQRQVIKAERIGTLLKGLGYVMVNDDILDVAERLSQGNTAVADKFLDIWTRKLERGEIPGALI